MRIHTISVIALSNRDFSSLDEKLAEAVVWLEVAAAQGAELVVLPECLNRYCGDGMRNLLLQTPDQYAFDDWTVEVSPLIAAACRLTLWVVVPVVHRQTNGIFNSFFLVSPEGSVDWQCDKLSPTPGELDAGVLPGQPSFFIWKGIKLGGGICFDMCFPANLDIWNREKVDLVLFPSLTPGGSQLNNFCKQASSRVALSYPAWSQLIDIDGLEVVGGGYRQETLRFGFGAPVYTASLNFDRVSLYGDHNQEKVTDILRKYGKRVGITYDQGNCLWFFESRDPDLSESQVMEEFGLITSRDYFEECERRIRAYRETFILESSPSAPLEAGCSASPTSTFHGHVLIRDTETKPKASFSTGIWTA